MQKISYKAVTCDSRSPLNVDTFSKSAPHWPVAVDWQRPSWDSLQSQKSKAIPIDAVVRRDVTHFRPTDLSRSSVTKLWERTVENQMEHLVPKRISWIRRSAYRTQKSHHFSDVQPARSHGRKRRIEPKHGSRENAFTIVDMFPQHYLTKCNNRPPLLTSAHTKINILRRHYDIVLRNISIHSVTHWHVCSRSKTKPFKIFVKWHCILNKILYR